MNHTSQRKAQFLGMPIGTAMNRLRKMVLFRLAEQQGLNVCFRCGQRIATYEALSLDHKRRWLGHDAQLFWELENVTFSHRHCNSLAADHKAGARERGLATAKQTRKVGPPGTSWCSGCQAFLPLPQFSRNRSGRNGYDWYCKACTAAIHAQGRSPRALHIHAQQADANGENNL